MCIDPAVQLGTVAVEVGVLSSTLSLHLSFTGKRKLFVTLPIMKNHSEWPAFSVAFLFKNSNQTATFLLISSPAPP